MELIARNEGLSRIVLIAAVIGVFSSELSAQIVVGMPSSFTGAFSARVKDNYDGAMLHLNAVNQAGGISGQKIELKTADDKNDPKLAPELAESLIVRDKAIALFLVAGTPQAEAILPVLEQFGVPLIAPSTGASSLRIPFKKYVFNLRADYQREAERLVVFIKGLGYQSIALLSTDDSFGQDSLAGAIKGFELIGGKPTLQAKFARVNPDIAALAKQIVAANPEFTLMIGSAASTALLIVEVRKTLPHARFATLSNNATSSFIKALGTQGNGVLVSQVMPGEGNARYPIAQEMARLNSNPGVANSPAMLEGYVAAKVLVEGLRRAGQNPSAAKLLAALNKTEKLNLGGLELSYTADNHIGLRYTDISMISKNNTFLR